MAAWDVKLTRQDMERLEAVFHGKVGHVARLCVLQLKGQQQVMFFCQLCSSFFMLKGQVTMWGSVTPGQGGGLLGCRSMTAATYIAEAG